MRNVKKLQQLNQYFYFVLIDILDVIEEDIRDIKRFLTSCKKMKRTADGEKTVDPGYKTITRTVRYGNAHDSFAQTVVLFEGDSVQLSHQSSARWLLYLPAHSLEELSLSVQELVAQWRAWGITSLALSLGPLKEWEDRVVAILDLHLFFVTIPIELFV